MSNSLAGTEIDWARLQRSLAIEAEKGFLDLQGRQYCFSEFLQLTFQQAPASLPLRLRSQWQKFAIEYAQYPKLGLAQRQHLIAQTRSYLLHLKKDLETPLPTLKPLAESNPEPITSKTKPITRSPQSSARSVTRSQTENSAKPITRSQTSTKPGTRSTQTVQSSTQGWSGLSLNHALGQVSGIGRHRSAQLAKLGIYYVRDLLFYYPRDYLDYANQTRIVELVPGETVTIIATIRRCQCFSSPKNRKLTIFELQVRDPSGGIKLSRFYAGGRFSNPGWQQKLKAQYPVGATIAASGLVKKNKYGFTLDSPEIEILGSPDDPIESLKIGRVLPVYALTEGVSADVIRKAIAIVLPAAEQLSDPLPATLRSQYELIGLPSAIANIHYPPDTEQLALARRRLVFDEFFYLQLGFLQRRQQQRQNQTSAVMMSQGEVIEQFRELLPFKLTNAQERVVQEILQDIHSPSPMNRLVQGDVGSGKTVVSVFAILAAIQSGYQAALMAPTEVLAEQHYRKLVGWFNLLHLPVELLTGSTKAKKRREIHSQLETGELPLLVGTHALIQDAVQFQRLGLVAIDEQHRFGVQQRAKLLAKGQAPHVLTMTATPIPRTLALTMHGDLDVSQIDELPPGRQPIQTSVISGKERMQAHELMRREIVQGRQAYVIFPMIETSEKLDVKAAIAEHQKLSESVFPEFSVGLLHGRMSSADKDKSLNAFRDRETQIIVSTTVIEVGVDVPNATVMLIENAERFGLSQLHQLRGRVGRGSHKSHCLLMCSSKNPDANQRLQVLAQSQDGFFIAEMDLRLRGPGQVLGTRQSGLPDFALASLAEDQDVLELARKAAEDLLDPDHELTSVPTIKKELASRYQRLLGEECLT
ncbi:MAG: ATP-dependent DNA helicase RecG [Cyanobacteria bacterium P01_H01_bin.15]